MVRGAGRTARGSVWLTGKTRRSRGGGGQPSGLDRERITEATVRLLDAEGLDGFSMRRLATDLNVTAMSLYWYVDTKDDLLELALDAVYEGLELPGLDTAAPGSPDPDAAPDTADAPDPEWPTHLRALATVYRALLVRHPWLSALAGRYLNIGPHALVFSRTVQRVVRRTGLPEHRISSAISAVFQFVYGYGTIEGHFFGRVADAGMTPDEYFQHSLATATEAPRAAEVLAESRNLMAARGGDTVAEMFDHDFTYALDLLIAGIEAMVERG
ncbi:MULTISPECIES: TetR/AcrR family transcriptional regulator [unclassified Streptomyces]|uniref:TetR/AcrR family transcriptional regulator n=1 Tax=unclassified Streptomyces TaxID=2593676 RepID=UPI003824A731